MHRFIVVDDSRATQSIIRRALVAGGYEKEQVHVVSSGAEAIELAATLKPDLIITDWHMPAMTGLEMLIKLRHSSQERVRVGIVTTETNEIRLAEARSHGVSFILQKPFRDEALLESVRQALAEPLIINGDDIALLVPTAAQVLEVANGFVQDGPWEINPIPLETFEHLSGKVLLGVFARVSDNMAIGLGLMDSRLVNLLGGLAGHLARTEILASIAGNKALQEADPHAQRFMGMLASLFDSHHHTQLTRASLVNVKLELLAKPLKHNRWGVAFELGVPGFASGSLALIRMS